MSTAQRDALEREQRSLEPLKTRGIRPRLNKLRKIEKTITKDDLVFHGTYNKLCREIVGLLRRKK